MYCYSLKHGKEYAKQAVKEDASGNYAKAFQFYMNALEYLGIHLKYENNPEIEKKIRQKSMGYLRRAEEIRAVLDSRRSEQPKPNLKGRKEKYKDKDKEDPEQVKLRVALDSVIIREKPNVKWSDVAGPESAKRALKKAVILPVRFLQFFTEKRKPWRALFQLYMNALEFLHTHLKYEKYPKIEKTIRQKSMGYLSEEEEIRAILDSRGSGPCSYSSPLVTEQPKPNLKGRKERDKYKEDPEQAKLRGGLDSVIIREKPNVEWSNVAGLESAKKALKEAVILPVRFPQFFTGKRKPWRAFLLYGPPGTGKSYLAKAVATEADSTFLSVSSSDLVSKWMGESEKLVSNLFQMARDNAPSIIFIDEIDSLCRQQGEGNETEASRRLKTELLVQIQGVGNDNEKVLVLAATNMPSALDLAIRRRFNKRIYIPLPDLKARGHMFKVHLGDTPHNLTESDFEDLAQRTEGFSGSDISVCVKDVLFEPVRKTQDARYFRKSFKGVWAPCEPTNRGAVKITLEELYSQGQGSKILPPPITKSDFDKVLTRQKPTVSKADLDVHDRFTKEFGEEGR